MKKKIIQRVLTEQEAIYILNAIFCGWQLLELLDLIEGTTFYKHGLKQRVNFLMSGLMPFVDGIAGLFQTDVTAMNDLMEHRRQLATRLIKYRPEIHSGFNELLERYFDKPEQTLKQLEIVISNSPK